MEPTIFLLGPSGAGKTTVATWAAADLDLLHLEVDRWPEGDGIDLLGLRTEWDAYWLHREPSTLAAALQARASAAGKRGCVASFASTLVLERDHILAAEKHGIRVAILYADGAACLEAFLQRESASGRKLDVVHWIEHNSMTYALFSRPDLKPNRLPAFAGRREMMAAIAQRLA